MTKLSMFCSFKYRHLVRTSNLKFRQCLDLMRNSVQEVEHENLGDSKINAYLNSWILKLI